MDALDYEAREARLLEVLKVKGKESVPPEVVAEFVEAKTALKLNVLADTFGGLMGPDALGAETESAGARYERALTALEESLGIGSGGSELNGGGT